jgi:hypothetical protein
MGTKALARMLNSKGLPSARRGSWVWSSLRHILVNPIYVGTVRFRHREVKLDRATGKRIVRLRDPSEQLTYQDESLRIIDDKTWRAVQEQVKAAHPELRHGQGRRGEVRLFTGLLHCGCGAVFQRRTCRDRSGVPRWTYLRCNEHRTNGDDRCDNRIVFREDKLFGQISRVLVPLLDDEGLLAEIVKKATAQAGTTQTESRRLRQEIGNLDVKIARLVGRLAEDLEPGTLAAINRECAKLETQRGELQKTLGGMAEDAGLDLEKVAAAVKQAIQEAKQNLLNVGDSRSWNTCLRALVGEMEVDSSGKITPRRLLPLTVNEGAQGGALGSVSNR